MQKRLCNCRYSTSVNWLKNESSLTREREEGRPWEQGCIPRCAEHMRCYKKRNTALNCALLFLQMDDLQHQLSHRSEQSPTESNHELTSKDQNEHDELASQLAQEKEHAREIAEECSALKSSLQQLENAKQVLDTETQNLRLEAEELREKASDLDRQLVESGEVCKVSEQRLQEEQERCEKLVKELEEYKLNDCSTCKDLEKRLIESKQVSDAAEEQLEGERAKYKGLLKELEQYKSNDCVTRERSGSVPLEMEVQKAKKESEELVKELTEERKAHETLRYVSFWFESNTLSLLSFATLWSSLHSLSENVLPSIFQLGYISNGAATNIG